MQWILLIASLLFASPSLAHQVGIPQGLEIEGRALDASAQPLEGATVFVYTAAPRVGTSSL